MGHKYYPMAQAPVEAWTEFENISNTPTASTFPCVAADTAGNVHVMWSEDIGGMTRHYLSNSDGAPLLDARGLRINSLTNTGNTIYYTKWDGQSWSEPNDIHVSASGLVQYLACVVDQQGFLNAAWVESEGATASLYFSRAAVQNAGQARAWQTPSRLAEYLLFALYPLDIAVDAEDGLHILFSQLGAGPGAYAILSRDHGDTWSDPMELFSTTDPAGNTDGVANIQLHGDARGHLHATWTVYGSDGNGKAIYYAQSADSGLTWSKPFLVDAWQAGWYEVDWLNTGVAGEEVHLVWEGSNALALQYERISYDGGVTWGAPHLILPNVRGENGFADLVTDSANHLYLLVVKRADPSELSNGIWFSPWQQNRWQDPVLLGTSDNSLYATAGSMESESLEAALHGTLTGNGLRYQRSVVVNGNQLFTIVVNEWDGEIYSSHTTLPATAVEPKDYPIPTPTPTRAPTPTPTLAPGLGTEPTRQALNSEPVRELGNPFLLVMAGVLPGLILLAGLLVVSRLSRH